MFKGLFRRKPKAKAETAEAAPKDTAADFAASIDALKTLAAQLGSSTGKRVRITPMVMKDGKVERGQEVTFDPTGDDEAPTHQPCPNDWEQWKEAMGQIAVPGWSPGMFATRSHAVDPPGLMFWYGIMRGDYGVFTAAVQVCRHPTGHGPIDEHVEDDDEPMAVLASLNHLPSGMGLGIFRDRATACEAADLIVSSGIAVEDHGDNRERWLGVRDRLKATWAFHGIVGSDDWHCHPGGVEQAYPILTKQVPRLWRDQKAAKRTATNGRAERGDLVERPASPGWPSICQPGGKALR